MISENNLKEMMDMYVREGELHTNKLNDLGFVSGDLTKLVHESNVLEREKRGIYKVNSEELFKYAKELILQNDLESAFNILHRCYLDDNTNIECVYNLFMVSILTDNYDISMKWYK